MTSQENAAEKRFSASGHLADLLPFQTASVARVTDSFYRNASGARYLVADETGLGKSLVARGVVAKAIEALQHDTAVARISIVYICSNADVARQNVKRLDVLHSRTDPSTRLSLLAVAGHRHAPTAPGVGKPVDLISLTPQTSFPGTGWRTGRVDERALLFLMLRERLDLHRSRETAAFRILRGTVTDWTRFRDLVRGFENDWTRQATASGVPLLDPAIVDEFWRLDGLSVDDSAVDSFARLVDVTAGHREVVHDYESTSSVIVRLRKTLARAGVAALAPNLIILDEFQRFSEFLRADDPVSELAQQMFSHPTAKVLLLSATPYKPYDLDQSTGGDSSSHRDQFMDTLSFLADGLSESDRATYCADAERMLGAFRENVIAGDDPTAHRDELRTHLLRVMCRTERPTTSVSSMVTERVSRSAAVTSTDIRQHITLTKLADILDTRLPMDVWKSVPALPHFMDAYQLGDRVAKNRQRPDVRHLLEQLSLLDAAAIERYEPLPQQNPRLQTLIEQTTGAGWHQLLWVPSSVQYLKPGGPYATAESRAMTKKLIFSQWSATPTAVSALLSHDANRRIARARASAHPGMTTRSRIAPRLQFRRSGGDLSAMASFLPFFPLPGLADQIDPLRHAGAAGQAYNPEYAELRFARELASSLPSGVVESGASDVAALLWQWPLMLTDAALDIALGGVVAGMTPADAIAARVSDPDDDDGSGGEDETTTALDEYVQTAIQVHRSTAMSDLRTIPHELTLQTARLAMHSPANCAWRSFGRLAVDTSQVTIAGRWRAAAVLASGLRTLFNRWESALTLDELYGDNTPYWQRVLKYCADGNLQAVLDEYLFHLTSVEGDSEFTDESVVVFARRAAHALKLSPAIYTAKNPLGDADIDFRSRFAMRYGDSRQNDQSHRPSDIREAFNSPFWPFVLVSTSVGQEGIDFHPWCHNLVHWNVPSSPVDFEQRDGRVNRFRGHAVRRNIVAAHMPAMLASTNPWRTAYEVAKVDAPHQDVPGLAPDWVFPGQWKVTRDVMPYRLSVDEAKIARVKQRVAYYRLAFGQARQEDLISLVEGIGVTEREAEDWRIDLKP